MMDKDGVMEGHFYFDPDDPIYADHFPGHPVVPGTMIIHAFLTAAVGRKWQSMPAVVQGFRFKRFISPGRYRYRFQKKEVDGYLACRLYDGHDVVVTGNLIKQGLQ